jgi:hypothetical protein
MYLLLKNIYLHIKPYSTHIIFVTNVLKQKKNPQFGGGGGHSSMGGGCGVSVSGRIVHHSGRTLLRAAEYGIKSFEPSKSRTDYVSCILIYIVCGMELTNQHMTGQKKTLSAIVMKLVEHLLSDR